MKSRLRLRDLCAEAIAGVLQRPGRTILTSVGTVLGVGAFVAVLGITATATGQIGKRFTALAATEVTVEAVQSDVDYGSVFPIDADARVQALNGVRHAGVYWPVDAVSAGTVTGVPIPGQRGSALPIRAATPGFMQAIQPVLREGRVFDQFAQDRAERVAVLGAGLAGQLGITSLRYQPAIFIGGIPFTVIGILADVARMPETLLEITVPLRTAAGLWGKGKAPERMLIATKLGAAPLIGRQAALALRPEAPERFRVQTPPDPRTFRDNVNTDLAGLFAVLAGLFLVMGAAGIANTTFVAVMERAGEIGLRRALGARRGHIAAQFLAESALLGGLGGVVGAGLGAVVVVGVALTKQWTPIMAPWTIGAAPLVGLGVGVLAGLYPAWRAARLEPVAALRR